MSSHLSPAGEISRCALGCPRVCGAHIVLRTLLELSVDTIFVYSGVVVPPLFDAL
jgi:hypothetical protein